MIKQRLALFALLVLLAGGMSLRAQDPVYQCHLMNDVQGYDGTHFYEFDVYLMGIGGPVELSGIQLGLKINPLIKNGGTLSVSMVPGSSQLNSFQVPSPEKFSFNAAKNCIILTPVAFPRTSNGTVITDVFPGTRVARFRLTNSHAWGPVSPNLSWSFSYATGYRTAVSAYLNTIATVVTVNTAHTTSYLSNPVFLPRVPSTLVNPSRTILFSTSQPGDRLPHLVPCLPTGPGREPKPLPIQWTEGIGFYQVDGPSLADITLQSGIDQDLTLLPNLPNPFKENTLVRFNLTEGGPVLLEIFDVLGKKLDVLLDETLSPGEQQIEWASGSYPPGQYLVRLQVGDRELKQVITKGR